MDTTLNKLLLYEMNYQNSEKPEINEKSLVHEVVHYFEIFTVQANLKTRDFLILNKLPLS